MKKSILIASFFLGTYAFAQTAEQRTVIQKSINKEELSLLETKFQVDYQKQQQKISNYLLANPDSKKTYTKDGNAYMLHHIDGEGNPIYICTKDANQVSNSKSNALYTGGSVGVNITGTSMIAGVWDGGQVNSNHELLIGNATMQPSQPANDSGGNNHMQAVTGIMVGKILTSSTDPNAATARGIAPDATTKNYDWDNDLAEMTSFSGNGFLISNHSYGYSNTTTNNIWNYGAYDETAKAWDALLKTTLNYLPFVAAGNEQQTSGNASAVGFDNMTGSSASKNVVTVGAINNDNTMSNYSNWGPADDGRVKPDIVTLGSSINVPLYTGNNNYTGVTGNSSGTSYSAPAAAAAGLLLQQYYFSLFNKYMTAASLKALMLHTADDAGNPGPDAKFGWGILNVENAAKTIKQMQNGGSAKLVEFTTNPTNDSYSEVYLQGVFASGNARASICWTDDDGTEQTAANGVNNTSSRLVYNFDMLFRQYQSQFSQINAYTFGPLSVTNPNAAATVSSTWFVNNVDNYRQANIAFTTANTIMYAFIKKSTSSPVAVRPFSVLVTGLKITNATLAVSDNIKKSATVFYSNEDGQIKMISNDAKDGYGDYKIFDMSGKLLKAGAERGNTISFQNDSNGVYILIYQNAGKEETFKFKK